MAAPAARAPGFRGFPGRGGGGRPKCAHEPPQEVFQGLPKGVFQAGFEAGIEAPHAALVGKYRNR